MVTSHAPRNFDRAPTRTQTIFDSVVIGMIVQGLG